MLFRIVCKSTTNKKSPSERIKELKELLQNDLISKDEFDLKKKLIIDELWKNSLLI